ncbi:AAA family ATPase [Deinococcus sp. QL22]|uniref:AAA family ATPase n=1 Tax=Deinococcus sp. QL22 TaxID=2939437 RepID=UPI00201748F2|nr:AAA family ATPase [Deinococcus sp. QL22]UQN09748.1 AAA family ATPase [Deinococcus sp. QL22]
MTPSKQTSLPQFSADQTLVPQTAPLNTDNDFRRLGTILRRSAGIIATSAALAAGTAYLLAAQQTPVYESSASLITVRDDGGSSLLNPSVFVAPSLPRGALQEALLGSNVRQRLLNELRARGKTLPPSTLNVLTSQVRGDLGKVLSVKAQGTGQLDGVFEVEASATTPQSAQILANAGAAALLGWDAGRAQQRLNQLRTSFESQFEALDTQLQAAPATVGNTRRAALERQTLRAARAQVLQNLAQVTALEQSTTGSLAPLASAELPRQAASPRPARSAALAALLTSLLVGGAALLWAGRRRTVYSEQDLLGWGVPVLGRLPSVPGASTGSGLLTALHSGGWRTGINFLRVNVLSQLGASTGKPRRLVVASAGPAEGRSSVTVALALSLAQSGERVLVVDADSRRAAQAGLWQSLQNQSAQRPTLAGEADRPVAVTEQIDLLPASVTGRPDGSLDQTRLHHLLDGVGTQYDTILFDTPPLLTSPDAVALAAAADGLVFIVVPGSTSLDDVSAAFDAARTARARVLGVLLNTRPRLGRAAVAPAPAALPRERVGGETITQ